MNRKPESATDRPTRKAGGLPKQRRKKKRVMKKSLKASVTKAFTLARTHFDAGELEKPEKICRRIINTAPKHARAIHLLGLIAYKKGEYVKAEDHLRQAIKGRPKLSNFHNDLGASLSGQGRHAEALAEYQQAQSLADNGNIDQIKGVYRNIALALQRVGRVDDALEFHARVLNLVPDDTETIWNQSHVFLARGQFKKGWSGYQRRLHLKSHLKEFERYRNSDRVWQGKPFKGKTLLVMDEQGLGDAIQFIRLLPMVKALGGKVVLETRNKLLPLLSSAPGFDEIINRKQGKERAGEFDLTVPMLSLPGILNIDFKNIPAPNCYLQANNARVKHWKKRLNGEGIKVGLVWTGNLENLSLRHRSVELANLVPFLNVKGVTLYSLQYGANDEEFTELPDGIHINDLGKDVKKFDELAAAITNMDLVITVDTAMAHVTGALGCPVWMLLSYPADWRWFLDRDDSPWYPSMRLFRQQQSGRWNSVLLQLHMALRELACKTKIKNDKRKRH